MRSVMLMTFICGSVRSLRSCARGRRWCLAYLLLAAILAQALRALSVKAGYEASLALVSDHETAL